jgi:hypothetical protein
MKTSTPVIRVSAVRAREGAPSLSSWLDSVQVRPLATLQPAAADDDRATAECERTAAAAEMSFIGFRIL